MRSAAILLTLVVSGAAFAESPLASRGYSVLPEPQRVTLRTGDFRFGPAWSIQRKGVAAGDIAAASLGEELRSRFHLPAAGRSGGVRVTLAIAPGSVEVANQAAADQAYRIDLASGSVSIAANAPAGLFYGVQTLVQLVTPHDDGSLWLPEGQIVDWPDLPLRQIYWDDAHHLDRPETFREAVRQAAFYKINGFVLKLEGHFQYKSAPAVVEPYAMSPAELQALTDYALTRHVNLVPYLDAPAHIAFVLKHPEYANLRAFPESNYAGCAVNPKFTALMEGMFQDLLAANKGVPYFYLSTDEPYYIGMSHSLQCDEAARAKELGSVGKVLAEFVTQTAGWLHDRGRTVVFWGEHPLQPGDIDSLPPYLVNGETYGPQFDPVFAKHGIRSMIYVSTQGEERLFPEYFLLPAEQRLHPRRGSSEGRVEGIVRKIATDPARQTAKVIGAINAGWADAGLHPETFWLGYAAGTAAAWKPPSDPQEYGKTFYKLFYGPHAVDLERVYRLMSWQAQFWSDSWETGPSKARKPIWGNSNGIFNPPRPAQDQFLPIAPAPDPQGARRRELAAAFLTQNDELQALLKENLQRADFNRYNLEVLVSIANLCRHNLELLLGRTDGLQREPLLRATEATWYKSWYPRVEAANGRRFLHELDDVKDHPADRTADLGYLLLRESLAGR